MGRNEDNGANDSVPGDADGCGESRKRAAVLAIELGKPAVGAATWAPKANVLWEMGGGQPWEAMAATEIPRPISGREGSN